MATATSLLPQVCVLLLRPLVAFTRVLLSGGRPAATTALVHGNNLLPRGRDAFVLLSAPKRERRNGFWRRPRWSKEATYVACQGAMVQGSAAQGLLRTLSLLKGPGGRPVVVGVSKATEAIGSRWEGLPQMRTTSIFNGLSGERTDFETGSRWFAGEAGRRRR